MLGTELQWAKNLEFFLSKEIKECSYEKKYVTFISKKKKKKKKKPLY